jgi:sugar O-acyltransferase (sialic acid O-acetyltransferase NeuD family)
MDNKSIIYGIYGVGGFAKEILPLLREEIYTRHANHNDVYFIVDSKYVDDNKTELNGCKIISYIDFLGLEAKDKYISIGIGNSQARKFLTDKSIEDGLRVVSIKSNNTVIYDNVTIGEGSVLCSFVTLTSDIKIGKGFQANLYSYVAHDCVIGDYVTFSPSVRCNGNVEIGDETYIGTGVIINPGKPDGSKPIKIGRNVTIGEGVIVSKNIPDDTVVLLKASKMIYLKK